MKTALKVPLLLALVASSVHAALVTLTFEGLRDLENPLNYYNGGLGELGSGPGPNYGITFGTEWAAIIDNDAGGGGNIANEPTPSTVLSFHTGPGAIINLAGGFDAGFSLFYSALAASGGVTVYDGLNGTGNVLGTLSLTPNGSSCGGDPNGAYNCWSPVGVAFSGIAKSVNISGAANQIVFDNVTFGASVPINPVPEPASLILAGAGLAVIAWRRLRD